jgi:hypothetical protein
MQQVTGNINVIQNGIWVATCIQILMHFSITFNFSMKEGNVHTF